MDLSTQGEPDNAPELFVLAHLLSNLPDTIPEGSSYGFDTFSGLDADWEELTGSKARALNHHLEVTFGFRSAGSIIFRERGPSLACVANVIEHYIQDERGNYDGLLSKWVEDLTAAAHLAYKNAAAEAPTLSLSAAVAHAPPASAALASASAPKTKKRKTAGDAHSDRTVKKAKAKAKADETAQEFNWTPDDLQDDEEIQSSKGRPPNELVRNPALKELVSASSAEKSLGAQLAQEDEDEWKHQKQHAKALQRQYDHIILCLFCLASLPPHLLDYEEWNEAISVTNPALKTVSSMTLSCYQISFESAHVLELSIQELKKQKNLTISYDGSTTRSVQSIYTVHVTTPESRQAYLMEGNEAFGVSHTAQHIRDVLLSVIDKIGCQNFAGICSDNTGNTKLARELVVKEIPSIIVLADPCHRLNNLVKDICKLDHFSALIEDRVIETKPKGKNQPHALHVLKSSHSSFEFENALRQLTTIIAPVAKAIKCLEAIRSTPADVYLYWLAVMATMSDIFKNKNADLELPSMVISEI
ncbi:hypothetical protein EW146_g9281 [Bondarzewia mesenterica]|uniref:DUF659 domain-containing protein n=1 Tax=Bondarzewia mesenterica TaxID=1095465 RepID=A0A4S4L7W7_9AGAM|nr:hypothetical protein EW146_g9281 [Bondarzewia mesenterica]